MKDVEPPNYLIWIVGLWHQGLVIAAVFAEKGFNVIGIASTTKDLESLKGGVLPIFEPGLESSIRSGLDSGKLKFAILGGDKLLTPDLVIFAHDTEVDNFDKTKLDDILEDFGNVVRELKNSVRILVTAQVPLGTCKNLENIAKKLNPVLNLEMAYMPENLRLGLALDRFRNIPLPVIGIRNDSQKLFYEIVFKDLVKTIHFCTVEESELLKTSLNCFLAVSVTFGNEIFRVAAKTGVNATKVIELLQLEHRIGNTLPMRPGLAFSGGTLARDIRGIEHLAEQRNVDIPMIQGVWNSNNAHKVFFVEYVKQRTKQLSESLQGRTPLIGVLGLTYKPGTNTLRSSISIWTCLSLQSSGFKVVVHDPMQDSFNSDQLMGLRRIDSAEELISLVDLVLVMTPWPEYEGVLRGAMQEFATKVIIDPFSQCGFIGNSYPDNYSDFVSSKEEGI